MNGEFPLWSLLGRKKIPESGRTIRRASRFLCAVIAVGWVVGLAWPAQAATVMVQPAKVTFTKRDQTATVRVTVDGKPLPASAMKGAKFLASHHNYATMIAVKRSNGELRITPTNDLEIGSYTLVVATTHGPATVEVLAPLSGLPNSLQREAEAQHLTVRQLKAKMGLTQKLAREKLAIALPSSCVEGQRLKLALHANPKRFFTWSVNGKVVKEGPGEHTFAYAFDKPGKYTLKVTEKADGKIIASATSVTNVTTEPAVHWSAAVAAPTLVEGPKGFQRYSWTLNGKLVAEGPTFKHTFSAPGQYTLECRAENPIGKSQYKLRHLVYHVTVKSATTR